LLPQLTSYADQYDQPVTQTYRHTYRHTYIQTDIRTYIQTQTDRHMTVDDTRRLFAAATDKLC